MNLPRLTSRRTTVAGALLCLTALTACAAPGAEPEQEAQTGADDVSTELTEEEVALDLYLETGFPIVKALGDEFTRQHPNITFNIREDQFAVITENAPRVLSGDDAPDLIRMPLLVQNAKDGLVLDLDPYFEAYDWDTWPESQLAQMRVSEEGTRGEGALYGVGVGYSVTGVYYNKQIAEQIGMTEPPATIEELEGWMEKAKAAGEQPIMQFNDIGGVAFPYQAVLNQLADPADLAAWIYNAEGATIDTPEAAEAAEYIGRWAQRGYFPEDANSLDYTGMMGRFTKGEGLFMFNGDWEAANLDKSMGTDKVGFFVMPPAEAGAEPVAMGAPNTYAVPANAEHPDEIVNFLNWVHTDEKAREIIVTQSGALPGGPAELPLPEVGADSLISQTLEGSKTIADSGVLIDFIANATAGIYGNSIRPELQSLLSGRTQPADLPKNVQQAYEEELGS